MRSLYIIVLILLTGTTLFAHDPVLPTGFVMEEAFVAGLNRPTDLKIAADGRIFIAEKGGTIRIVENGMLLTDPFYAVQTQTPGERGLDGIALDPDFETNGFVYLYYTLPNASQNVVARVTAAGNTAIPGSEVELFRLDEMWAAFHNGAAMVFDSTGALIIGVGDGTGWAWAQQMNSTLGKILRIHPDGSIPTDNPFYNQNQGDSRAIAAYGVRNPFTMAVSQQTGRIFFNDVGHEAYEEVNEYILGRNYGWHDVEGPLNGAPPPDNLYKDPIHAYDHDFGCAIVGATFYEPEVNLFPADYFGKYFFLDLCEGKLVALHPDNFETEIFASEMGPGYNNIEASHDGYLYLINFNEGLLSRISFQGANAAPLISIQPQDQIVPVGENVNFSTSAVGEGLRYTWYRDGAVVPSVLGPDLLVPNVQMADNQARFSVRVANANGEVTSASALLTVVNGSRPTIQLQGIPASYAAGDTLNFSASVTDPDQQTVPAADLTWKIDFHHDVHYHPALAPVSGIQAGQYIVGTYGEVDTNVYFRVHLTAVDSTGLTASSYQDIAPEKVSMLIGSVPPGVEINIDGMKATTDYSLRSVRNLTRTIEVPGYAVVGDSLYEFVKWADGQTAMTRAFAADTDTLGLEYVALQPYDHAYATGGNMTGYTGIGDNRRYYRAVQVSRVKENWDVQSPFWHDLQFQADSFSVRWEGNIVAPVSDWYTFYLLHDGKVQFRLGDLPLLQDSEAQLFFLEEDTVRVWLDRGEVLALEVDYEHYQYVARIELDWEFSIVDRHPVPFGMAEPPAAPIGEVDSIRIFPNPVGEELLYFSIGPDMVLAHDFRVEIFDHSGRRYLKKPLRHSPTETASFQPEGYETYAIAVTGLAPGIYILKLSDENGTHVRRFLKY